MSAQDYISDDIKLYNFIEYHVKNKDSYDNPILEAMLNPPDRRGGHDRRKKTKYAQAQATIKLDDAEVTVTGDRVSIAKCKDGTIITAAGAAIKKK
jgi:hypothetical protein